ncbi:uncharacterized protein DNG_01643 [Cephalotrichum gorgonifer]|uniref:Uncharacterized protein n=1 Tax=Cephalotrichum gorgonifer TaxID=2041049 RepID=A0AAE8SS03_9PEZI|nr:uncharacterized protein DNG_01643 [Cephalotrichum gorgonifer]
MQIRLSTAALLQLSICLIHAPAALGEDDGTKTTVSVYLPFYGEKWWADMHGSVISKDDKKTEYTIFCPTQTPQRCNLAGEAPFTFTEGSETLIFHGTLTSTYIMNLECDLDGKTAATCSGYSSLRSGYVVGSHTGPTEITWKSTFTETDVAWAAITLTDKIPQQTNGALVDITATAMETPPSSTGGDGEIAPHGFPSEDTIFPLETGAAGDVEGTGARWGGGRWASVAVGVAGVLAGVLL